MNALKPKPPFQVLVMSEESRLGREAIETAYALKRLVTAGVRVFFYLEDRERTLNSPMEKAMLSLQTMADEMEREKARQRTYDAMLRKAQAKHVTGGRTFGYANVPIVLPGSSPTDGPARRSHVVRRVNEEEAKVVRRIFQLCADGYGIATIAKTLNIEGAQGPRPQQGRPRAWAPSSVREILHRGLYRGESVWNRTRKRNQWGLKQQHARPEQEWIRVPVPELRIVSDKLWTAAHDRLDRARAAYLRGTKGQLWGHPTARVESKYLLTGLARCGICRGSLYVKSRSHGRKRAFFYGCTSFHLRGRCVCRNGTEMPMEAVNRAVLGVFERDILSPSVIEPAVSLALARLTATAGDREEQCRTLRDRLREVEIELERFLSAIAVGGELGPLVSAVQEREDRRNQLRRQLTALESTDSVRRLDSRKLEENLRARLEDWRGLLHRQIPEARQILRKLLTGYLVFTPVEKAPPRCWEFTGQATLTKFLSGLVVQNAALPVGDANLRSPRAVVSYAWQPASALMAGGGASSG